MIEINKIKVNYNGLLALDINQKVIIEDNDKIGIIGSNGSGKTTFIKALLELVKSDKEINSKLSINDMAVHLQHNDYVDTVKVKSIIDGVLSKDEIKSQRFNDLIRYFDFEKNMNKKYRQLSGGEKQRLTIILVLMQDKKLTFFDEVTTGLDFETRNSLMDKISEWFKNSTNNVILVTHYYEELERLTNKILILDQGKLIDYGKKEDLFNKYCGYSVIMYEESDSIILNNNMIEAPNPYKAIKCSSKSEEMEIIKRLNEKGINFKRTNKDIELVYLNALKEKKNV